MIELGGRAQANPWLGAAVMYLALRTVVHFNTQAEPVYLLLICIRK